MTEAFKRYQQVVCTNPCSYEITAGKKYIVLSYSPTEYIGTNSFFLWPAYVDIYDDNGNIASLHADRFKSIPREDYDMTLYNGMFEVDVHYGLEGCKTYYETEPFIVRAASEEDARDVYNMGSRTILEFKKQVHIALPRPLEDCEDLVEIAREVRNVSEVFMQQELAALKEQCKFLIDQNSALQEKMHSLEAEVKTATRERDAGFCTHRHIEQALRDRIMELETYLQEHKND